MSLRTRDDTRKRLGEVVDEYRVSHEHSDFAPYPCKKLGCGCDALVEAAVGNVRDMNGHAIRITLQPRLGVRAEFICNEPDDVRCHRSCERVQCEDGCVCDPSLKDWAECPLITWLDNGGTWDEQYGGPQSEVRSGPIEINWNGDSYEWRYAT